MDSGVKVAKLRDDSADDKAMMTPVMVDTTTTDDDGDQIAHTVIMDCS